MSEVKMSETKRIITIRFIEEELRKKGIFPEREELNYFDMVSPKVFTLLGTKECLSIYNGEDERKSFENRGLNSIDQAAIEDILKDGFDKQKNGIPLSEIDLTINNKLFDYLVKIRSHLLQMNNSFELKLLQEEITKCFQNNSVVLDTPCTAYENLTEQKKM